MVNGAGNQLTVKSPAGTAGTTVDVRVKTPANESPVVTADHFTYGPVITSLSRTTGPVAGGTKVTINGAGFLTVQHVKFGARHSVLHRQLGHLDHGHHPGTRSRHGRCLGDDGCRYDADNQHGPVQVPLVR